jgi:hypothetical protein
MAKRTLAHDPSGKLIGYYEGGTLYYTDPEAEAKAILDPSNPGRKRGEGTSCRAENRAGVCKDKDKYPPQVGFHYVSGKCKGPREVQCYVEGEAKKKPGGGGRRKPKKPPLVSENETPSVSAAGFSLDSIPAAVKWTAGVVALFVGGFAIRKYVGS